MAMMCSDNALAAAASLSPEEVERRGPGFVKGGVRTTLRLEGVTVLAVCLVAYTGLHASWWLFAALFLVPDVSFLAYLIHPKWGAIAYNTLHSYIGALILGLIAHVSQGPVLLTIALIWAAHIGFDRAAGYGLKYASAFGDTHLGYKGGAYPRANTTKDVAN